jgi:flagellin
MVKGFNTTVTTGGTTVYIPVGSTDGYALDDPLTPISVGTGSTTSVSSSGVLTYANSDEFVSVVQMALQQVADMRAQNGAEMSRVNFAQDLLNINAINLEAANSRIIDVDVASESSQLARFQILQQAGTAMLAQANTSQQSLVRLLQG